MQANHRHVLLGGLIAGLAWKTAEFVFGAMLFRQPVDDALLEAGARLPGTPAFMLQSLVIGLFTGTVAIWLYAELRSSAPGRRRAALNAGAIVWFLTAFVPSHQFLITRMFPPMLVFQWISWSLAGWLVATALGAIVYDGQARTTRRAD